VPSLESGVRQHVQVVCYGFVTVVVSEEIAVHSTENASIKKLPAIVGGPLCSWGDSGAARGPARRMRVPLTPLRSRR